MIRFMSLIFLLLVINNVSYSDIVIEKIRRYKQDPGHKGKLIAQAVLMDTETGLKKIGTRGKLPVDDFAARQIINKDILELWDEGVPIDDTITPLSYSLKEAQMVMSADDLEKKIDKANNLNELKVLMLEMVKTLKILTNMGVENG